MSHAPQDLVEFQDEGNLELTMKMLEYLCEGNHRLLKAYLRDQTDNITKFDLVSLSVSRAALSSLLAIMHA